MKDFMFVKKEFIIGLFSFRIRKLLYFLFCLYVWKELDSLLFIFLLVFIFF